MTDHLIIRRLSSLEEYQACADFQEEVWGRGFSEKVSAAILMIANRLGGIAAGAFDASGTLHGFVFGLTGVVDGRLVHWSDMLAVRSEGRDRGLGTRLKLYQREALLAQGVREMRWTFDPLQARNAHVNFSKLGIVCRDYVENMYGHTDSPLHRGIGTDRFIARWFMDSPRVESRIRRATGGRRAGPVTGLPSALSVDTSAAYPVPGSPMLSLEDPRVLVPVPADVNLVMGTDLDLAVRWREATRKVLTHYFSRGYEAREFIRGERVSYYLLGREEPDPESVPEGGER